MPLSDQTLHPLTDKSVEFFYCHDRPLRCIATRYTLKDESTIASNPNRVPCAFVFSCGLSFNQETWLPVIKEIYRLASLSGSKIRVLSAWVIERPNHGESGLLNEKELLEFYTDRFPSKQYASAMRTFFSSRNLSAEERANLIGVGHSAGGGSLIEALQPATDKFPLKSLILVESPHIGYEGWQYFQLMFKAVKYSNSRRQTTWASKAEAMEWFKTHAPWKAFHPDILQIVSETYFMPDPQAVNHLTTKTKVTQETASFLSDGSHLGALPYLRTILHLLPTHQIVGSVLDFWPPPVYKEITKNTEEDRSSLASIVTIPGVGHYIPLEKPKELAAAMMHIIDKLSSRPKL